MAIDLIGVSVQELSVGVFLKELCYLHAFVGPSKFKRSLVININGEIIESKQLCWRASTFVSCCLALLSSSSISTPAKLLLRLIRRPPDHPLAAASMPQSSRLDRQPAIFRVRRPPDGDGCRPCIRTCL